jgi:DNA-binding beta-propeller fold protein YncE
MRKYLTLAAATLLGAAIAGCQGTSTPAPAAPTPGPTITTTPVGDKILGITAAGGNIYCACAGFVDLYSADSGQRVKRIDLGGATSKVRAFIDRRHVLVQDETKGELRVLDPDVAGTNSSGPSMVEPGTLLQTIPVGKGAASLAFGDGNQVVASSAGTDDKVLSFFFTDDRAAAPKKTEWPVGSPAADGRARPLDWKDGRLLTVDFTSNALKLFSADAPAGKTLATLGQVGLVGLGTDVGKPTIVKGASEGLATTAVGVDAARDAMVLVDLATSKATTLTDLGKGARSMLMDPDNGRVWLAMYDSDEVAVVDYRAMALIKRIPVAHHPVNVALAPPVEGEIWVAGEDGGLSVLTAKTNDITLKATLQVGKGDHRMTFWGTKGYVSNQADGTLTTIERINFR